MTVSVCIPTFNQASYLEGCIKSVLSQTMQPLEIIVSNDASTDDTKLVLDKLVATTKLLKVIHQPKNIGITANVNACFKEAKGDYIVRLDSDDMLLPDYILKLCSLFQQYPNAGYAHCAVYEIDTAGKKTRTRSLFRNNMFESSDTALVKALNGYKVAANIVTFKKSALEATKFIQCPFNFAEDFYLTAAIADKGYGNIYTPAVLASYRVWNDKGNKRSKRKLEEIKGLNSVFDDIIKPAFKKRGFDIRKIYKAKQRFARAQSDCLAWGSYNEKEKEDIKTALYKLSSSPASRLVFYLHEKKIYFPALAFKYVRNTGSMIIKKLKGF